MKAIILCAGYATRLYPLTLNTPKALLPIAGKPLLSHTIEKIKEVKEIDEIIVVTNDKFYGNFKDWAAKIKGEKIKIINDKTKSNEERLGLGDLLLATDKLNDDVLVILGDNLFDFDLNDFIESFKKTKKTTIGVYDVKTKDEAKKFGIVNVKDGKATSFEEKPKEPKSTLASIGLYIFSKQDLPKIEKHMKSDNPKEGPGHFIQHLIQKQEIYAFVLKGKWFDIGNKETYELVDRTWK